LSKTAAQQEDGGFAWELLFARDSVGRKAPISDSGVIELNAGWMPCDEAPRQTFCFWIPCKEKATAVQLRGLRDKPGSRLGKKNVIP
jgi:hypothetical protein